MLVQYALGIAGGAAGIAEHARITLWPLMPGKITVVQREDAFKTVRPFAVEADIPLNAGPLRFQTIDDRLKLLVIQQHPVIGMIADIDELFVEQTRVNGVDNPAHPDHTVPGREVTAMVHGQGGDPITGVHAHGNKRLR